MLHLEPLDVQQVQQHRRRQVLDLIRDQDAVGFLDLHDGAETQELYLLDLRFGQVELNHDVFGP